MNQAIASTCASTGPSPRTKGASETAIDGRPRMKTCLTKPSSDILISAGPILISFAGIHMVDMSLACRLAKACDCSYYLDAPAGIASCPRYADVGFLSEPKGFLIDAINACYV